MNSWCEYLEAAGVRNIRLSSDGAYGTCPYHSAYHRSKGLPFSFSASKGVFVCHSATCGRTGTLATLLAERVGMSWRRAREIQDRVCVRVRSTVAGVGALPAWRKRHEKAEDPSMEAIDPALLGVYERCPRYMLNRGFTMATLRSWDVGYDAEENRVTFPVWSADGSRLLGFTKRRAYETEDPMDPAYLHVGFRKGLVLYGQHRVAGVSERYPLFVHEGTPSVLWQSQQGFPNGVATLGSRVSQEQVDLLSGYSYVVLCFDDDDAGRKATLRVLFGTKQVSWQDGRRKEVQVPGLVSRVERGRLRVVQGWPEGAKDYQEIRDGAGEFLMDCAVPWERWEGLNL